jgi:hypothetical protein
MVLIINPLERENWDIGLLSNEDYSFFHTAPWASVLHESYGYKPVYFSIHEESHPVAMLPFMEVNSPIKAKEGFLYLSPIFANQFFPMVISSKRFSTM